ncbi:MAG: hypothetical protein J6U79_01550 [Paludibacteraceae bacterium]|nr:hypothetical protein [Paludibacteraceae bacterium]MBR5469707.1 hypothetical protein [Paludibacteraceae bacterium]
MKKINFLIVIFVSVVLFLASCNKIAEKSSLYKNLKAETDSLIVESQMRNADLVDICKTIDDVVAGLDNIREEERTLALQSAEVAVDEEAKVRATENLKTIVLSIERYKQQITKLEQKLKLQPAQFRATINNLKKSLEEKDLAISALSTELGLKESILDSIRTRVVSLELANDSLLQQIDEINGQIEAKQEIIDEQNVTINTGFYVLGTQSELKKMGVLLKKKVNPKVDSRKFTKIDIRKNKEINLSTTKQIKLVSLHPEGSYSIEINKFGSKTLKIKDPDAFWKQTRYLVVVFK